MVPVERIELPTFGLQNRGFIIHRAKIKVTLIDFP